MKQTLWSTLVFLFMCTIAQAQTLAVKGNVVSEADGEPIVGVSVVENGSTSNGTITDLDGNFTLVVPLGAELNFSSLGFKSVTLKAVRDMQVELAVDSELLDDVIVTGYMTEKKASLTGSVAVVKMKDVADIPTGNIMQSLQGRVAGMNITTDGDKSGKRKDIRIHEMHMEEDAGKLTHEEAEGISLIDYNRSGVPLVEIVSEPDMENAEEVVAYLEKLRMICLYLGISDCKLQEGSMRVDVNLSVKEAGSMVLGTRTEMKNLNSFKAIGRAIEAERGRQIAILEAGKQVEQETRRWDDAAGCSYSMRSKEDSKDYRYFPEPDLPPVRISEEWIGAVRAALPELQEEKAARFATEYDITAYDAGILTQSPNIAGLFEKTAKKSGQPKKTANWFMGELFRILKERSLEAEMISFSPEYAAKLITEVEKGRINQANAKEVFEKIVTENMEPMAYIEEHGLRSVSDEGVLLAAVREVMEECAAIVEEYRSGKEKVFGFLVGQVMKKTKGKAAPATVNELLKKQLSYDKIE